MANLSIFSTFKAKDGLTPFFKKATRSSNVFSNKLNRSLNSLNSGINKFAKLGAIGFASISAGAFFAFRAIDKVAQLGDEIGKTSRQLGISVEALQEWRFIAERQGLTSDTLTKSFKLLNRNIGDLRINQGMLKTTLERSNPRLLQQLRNTNRSEEAFALLVEEIGKLETAQDKAALAQAAFGRSGQDIIKIAELSTDAIAGLKAEAHSLGFIMDKQATANAEKFQDELTNLKKAIFGLKLSVGAELIPTLTKLIKSFVELIKINRTKWLETLKIGFDKILGVLKFIWRFRKLFSNLAIGLLSFVAAVKAIIIVTKLWAAVQWLLNVALNANPIGIIITGIGALGAALVWALHRMEWLTNSIDFFKKIGTIAFEALNYWLGSFSGSFETLEIIATQVFSGLKSLFNSGISALKKVIDFFNSGFGKVGSFVLSVIARLKSGLLGFASSALDFLITPLQKALQLASNLPGFLGGDKAAGALESILAMRQSLSRAAEEARQEASAQAINIVSREQQARDSKLAITLKSEDGSTAIIKEDVAPNININNMALGGAQ